MIDLERFEDYLAKQIPQTYRVEEAMNYSLLARSKRIRPLLLLSLMEDLSQDHARGFPAAAALEMVHTYSLIHDDLPAFDNDDMRRGKPSCHKAFDEETAILAGDALLTYSFQVLSEAEYDPQIKVELISLLSKYSGKDGMIKGQALDMMIENQPDVDFETLKSMDILKTGKLLTLPFLMALHICRKTELTGLFENVGTKLGIAFQIQDDLLDVLSDSETMGKSLSDANNNKTNYVTVCGIEEAIRITEGYYTEINNLLDGKYENVQNVINSLRKRKW